MTEEILKDIYRIQIALPDNPLRSLNAYLIRGDRNLLIDTGFNRDECYEELSGALDSLGVNFGNTDIFITHLHSDHCGLVSRLIDRGSKDGEGCKVYCSEKDGKIINDSNFDDYWRELEEIFMDYGFPPGEIGKDADLHPGKKYRNIGLVDFETVKDGDVIAVGEYKFTCTHTPGHTPGHICLYEKDHEILISGDHILGDITPNICIEACMPNPLSLYFDSLNRIDVLPVKKTLCSHRGEIRDVKVRIGELKAHHRHRLAEVMNILSEGGKNPHKNAYEVAQFMTWRISCKNWEDFPSEQKWFATGEAISHLNYLVGIGDVEVKKIAGVYNFQISY